MVCVKKTFQAIAVKRRMNGSIIQNKTKSVIIRPIFQGFLIKKQISEMSLSPLLTAKLLKVLTK